MAFPQVLAAALLAVLASSSVCPTYSCSSSLPQDVCGIRLSDQAFQINANGCTGGNACSATEFEAWVKYEQTSTFDCRQVYDEAAVKTNWTATRCYPHEYNKGFRTNSTIFTCFSDQDCKLDDGTYAACVCVFRKDGMGVCNADKSNDYVFGGYWADCKLNYGNLKDQHAYLYWNWLINFWVWTQSDVECKSIFWETSKLTALQLKYQGAAELAVGLLGMTIAFN